MRKWLWFLNDNRGFAGEGEGEGEGEAGEKVVKVDHQAGEAGETYTPPEIDMATAIPPEHRNKEYFKDITFEKMTNEFVNLQTKLGERPTVAAPGPDATQEQRDTFYNSLRPKEMSEYTFPETDFSKANAEDENFKKTSEEFQTGMRAVFHEAGISQHQADKLTVGYDKLLEATKAKAEADDAAFDQKITDTFGDQREAALIQSKNLMKENIPEDMKPLLDNLPNDALLLLTTTLQSVHKKYIAEDKVGSGDGAVVGDTKALRADAMKIYQSEEYRDFRNPGNEAAVKKYNGIYEQIAAIQKAELATKK